MATDSPASEIDQFLGRCLLSGLLEFEQLVQAWEAFGGEPGSDFTAAEFCDYLVRRGTLTSWQCGKLRDGRWKGFFLDDLKLVSHIRVEQACSLYLAEDLKSKQQVVLRVKPYSVEVGRTEYTVEPFHGETA